MSVLKKIKWWMWLLFPVALVILVVYFFRRGSGLGAFLRSPPCESSAPRSTAPAVTPERAEEIREEIREEMEIGEKKAETEAEALRRKAREKFGNSERS